MPSSELPGPNGCASSLRASSPTSCRNCARSTGAAATSERPRPRDQILRRGSWEIRRVQRALGERHVAGRIDKACELGVGDDVGVDPEAINRNFMNRPLFGMKSSESHLECPARDPHHVGTRAGCPGSRSAGGSRGPCSSSAQFKSRELRGTVTCRTPPGHTTTAVQRSYGPHQGSICCLERQPFFHDIANTAVPINSIKQRLLCCVYRHDKVLEGVTPVDQNGCGPGRQPLLNADRFWHSQGHIARPGVAGKTDLLRLQGYRFGRQPRCGEPSCPERVRQRHTALPRESWAIRRACGIFARTPH